MLNNYLRIRKHAVVTVMALFLPLPVYVLAQVNTEAMRGKDGKQGFHATVEYSYELKKGNVEFESQRGDLRIDYRKNGWHAFLVINKVQAVENKEIFDNSAFIHLRGVRSVNARFSLELFSQYGTDDFIMLKNRYLAGAGGRALLTQPGDRVEFFIGLGLMREHEEYLNDIEKDADLLRSTNYFTLTYSLNEHVLFDYTQYVQFDTGNFHDYRTIMDLKFNIKLSKILSLVNKLTYRYDRQPLPGVKKYDFRIINGVAVSF